MIKVEISKLPKLLSGFQRKYIDKFYEEGRYYLCYLDEFWVVVDACYGDCKDYPNGFCVYLDKDDLCPWFVQDIDEQTKREILLGEI